ncbi:MAG: glycosyltransferase [Clostridia bacterium]|nr:glycosyltransferase [Clostridia bacterium]
MISILMPVYNVSKYLEKTAASLKAQTFGDFEVIMVDDGSTDGSGLICDKIAEEDARFRVIHQPNAGVSAARNAALDEVRGEYIYFLDGDDLLLPETFEEMLALLNDNAADFVTARLSYIDDDGNAIEKLNKLSPVKDEILTGEEYLHKLTKENSQFYCTSTNKLFKAALFEGVRYPVGRVNEDEARIHEVVYKAKKIVSTGKAYYFYLKHSGSITTAPFTLRSLDRDEAFGDRLSFYVEKCLCALSAEMFVYAVSELKKTLNKSLRYGIYGEAKERLLRIAKKDAALGERIGDDTPEMKAASSCLAAIIGLADAFPKVYGTYLGDIADDGKNEPSVDIAKDYAEAKLIQFVAGKGYSDFAVASAMDELKSRATLTFIHTVKKGMYHGENKKKLLEIFRIEYPLAAKTQDPTPEQKQVLAVSSAVCKAPWLYAAYIRLREKVSPIPVPEEY